MSPVKEAGFWRWFSDSQVVDGRGRPLIVYHGTNQPIDQFSRARLGENTNSASSRTGFYFTENPEEAAEYAALSARKQVSNAIEREATAERLLAQMDRAVRRGDHEAYERLCMELEKAEAEAIHGGECGANIYPAVLAVCNPYVLDMGGSVELHVMAQEAKAAKARGHDGVKLLNVFDPVTERPELFVTTQWIVFSARQIRSAIEMAPILTAPRPALVGRRAEPAGQEMCL